MEISLNSIWGAEKRKTKGKNKSASGIYQQRHNIKKWHIFLGSGRSLIIIFWLLRKLTSSLWFCSQHFRKSLNTPSSHSDLWQLIALILLELTARTKLDSQEALCVPCSWQVLIRGTLFPILSSCSCHNPHHLNPNLPLPLPCCQDKAPETIICLQRSTKQEVVKLEQKGRELAHPTPSLTHFYPGYSTWTMLYQN